MTYDTTGFLVKNKDTIHGDLINVVQKSESQFVQNLFHKDEPKQGITIVIHNNQCFLPSTRSTQAHACERQTCSTSQEEHSGYSIQSKFIITSNYWKCWKIFQEELRQLMTILSSTDPHFIRAIKPNNFKKPGNLTEISLNFLFIVQQFFVIFGNLWCTQTSLNLRMHCVSCVMRECWKPSESEHMDMLTDPLIKSFVPDLQCCWKVLR